MSIVDNRGRHEGTWQNYRPPAHRHRLTPTAGWHSLLLKNVPRQKNKKPVSLVVHMIRNSSTRQDRVLDLCGGSGTTLIACEKLKRQARLMELDPRYCDVIIKRWQEFTGQVAKHENGQEFKA
ncbi:DNA methyltransferase [Endozoicomonas sp. ALD040]|uniref:DNA methyltransferase n=1 Tax=Endozoicomonas sp. ALD040 TaxID=3403079 RepID=UPI003BB00820